MTENNKITLPILITKGLVLFPNNQNVVYVEREFSKNSLLVATNNNSEIIVTCQKSMFKEYIDDINDIYNVGTKCKIIRHEQGKNAIKIILLPLERVKISNLLFKDNAFFADLEPYPDVSESDQETEQVYINRISSYIRDNQLDILFGEQPRAFYDSMSNGMNALNLSYLFAHAINIETDKKQLLLEAKTVLDRIAELIKDFEILKLRNQIDRQIQTRIKKNTDKQQKEYYLREQLKAIKQELNGGEDNDETRIRKILEKGNYPQEVIDKTNYELSRMENIPQGTLEYSLILDYLDILLNLPFNKNTEDIDDIKQAKEILDEDHYGLEKVKDRIIEYLAIKKINGNLKAPVLCFYGPPGTGKTSLSISIARALGRKFVKASFGGISDEAEIRGHRRTYVGSKPGRIINALTKAGVNNPVICLDEIDKLSSQSFKGDPASALLEVLDPEQNTNFRDNYVEVEYDLSKCLFICTCNYLENVPEPLRDRLELIPVDSYTILEKIEIAKRHLIKKEAKNHGLDPKKIKISTDAIELIIERYTREAGVRDLSRKIGQLLRKAIVEKMTKNEEDITIKIGVKEVRKYLGVEIFNGLEKEKTSQVGIVTGLAYTQYGGDVLPIEVNYFKGKGNLILTGNLGDVMKESCSIALDYVKSNAEHFKIDSTLFEQNDVHIHCPEGAVPKDGPSAGIAISCALVSAFTNHPVSNNVAMTGEVNLRGNALAIGGLREKTLAALRSGIKKVLVPKDNLKDVNELPKEVKDNLEIVLINKVEEAINNCFTN